MVMVCVCKDHPTPCTALGFSRFWVKSLAQSFGRAFALERLPLSLCLLSCCAIAHTLRCSGVGTGCQTASAAHSKVYVSGRVSSVPKAPAKHVETHCINGKASSATVGPFWLTARLSQ